ncbi:MAG: hypothetical protein FWD28_09185 [Treponema sp.]|nr:hypothetical protein [Treponema sp.]
MKKLRQCLYIAVLIIFAILIAACMPKTASQEQSGAFNGLIIAQVHNGESLNNIIRELHVTIEMNIIFSVTGTYSNGGFTFQLPEAVDSALLSKMSNFPEHYNISDRNANFLTFSEIFGTDNNGSRIAKFRLRLNDTEYESVYVSFYYVDRDVTIDGMILKKGWNKVQTTEYWESGSIEQSNAPIDDNLKWVFDPMESSSIDETAYNQAMQGSIRVMTVTNDTISKLQSYMEYTDDNRGIWLMFTADRYYEDFWFIEISYFDDPSSLYVPRILYKCQIMPDLPFLVMLSALGGIPQRGVSYIDESGIRRYFYISEDGVDGGYNLIEFTPQSFG